MSFGPELVFQWSVELNKLSGRRLQKVEGGDSWAALSFVGCILLLSWGAQNCGAAEITEDEKKSLLSGSKQVPPITGALKSQIGGAEFVAASQIRSDRILRLEFRKTLGAGFSNTRFLTLETMERYSNLILTDENNIVIEAAKHINPSENRYRSVLPQQPYVLPPEFTGISAFDWLKAPSMDTVRSVTGFGRPLIRLFETMDIETVKKCVASYASKETAGMTPQIIGKYITALPVTLDGAKILSSIADTGRAAVFNVMLDGVMSAHRKRAVDAIKHEITRRERQMADMDRLLHGENAERYKSDGEVIVANMWQIKPGASSADIVTWGGDGNRKTVTVALDPSMQPSQYAAKLFAKYKKITSARERAAKLLVRVRAELDEFNEQLALASTMDTPEEIRQMEEELGIAKTVQRCSGSKKQEYRPPHKRFNLGFALVFAGLSAKGNRYVTFHAAGPEDVWFHAQGVPGSHVILRYTYEPDAEQRETALNFCASLAVHFSKGRDNPKQRVDYTLKKYVSPIKGGIANVTYKEFKSVSGDGAFWEGYLKSHAAPAAAAL